MEQVWGQCVYDYSIELVSLSRYTWIEKFKLSVQVFVLHVQDWGAYMLLQNVEMPVLMPVFEESTFSGLFVIICNKYVVIRGKL